MRNQLQVEERGGELPSRELAMMGREVEVFVGRVTDPLFNRNSSVTSRSHTLNCCQ